MKIAKFRYSSISKEVLIIGVDEAGRGAWAGPVVAACVCWAGKSPFGKNSLNDSKKMTAIHREKTYQEILELEKKGKIFCGVGIVENTIIDEVGIREANRLAMELAIFEILHVYKGSMYNVLGSMKRETDFKNVKLLIDGRDNYSFDIPNLPKPEYIVRGDSIVSQIMASSILAKVTRDSLMREFDADYPGYGFAQHKGYGTALHQKGLQSLGVCAIHRRSYRPVKELLLRL